MKSETYQIMGILTIVVITMGVIITLAYQSNVERLNKEKEVNRMKQALIQSGAAWYNPTNGQFQILTNK